MDFSFDRRGNTVVYERLETVLAGPREALSDPGGILKDRLREQGLSWAGEAGPPFAPSWRTFQNAGWAFIQGAPGKISEILAESHLLPGMDLRWVYRDALGEVRLGTQCFAVRMNSAFRTDEAEARLAADGFELVHAMRFGTNLFEVREPKGLPWPEIKARLADRNVYTSAEPLFVEVLEGRGEPDPGLCDQWHHDTIGSALAWKNASGAGIRIAVIDNGMNIQHRDLKEGVVSGGYYRTGERCGGEFHRLEKGNEAEFPKHDHGTFCMGLAAAGRDNGWDGCGVAPDARLMAIACATDQTTTQFTLARAVAFAADPRTERAGLNQSDGAHVLACSLGSTNGYWSMSWILEEALRFARVTGRGGLGLPIFWAVTNAPVDICHDEVCSDLNVIAVGQSSKADVVVPCGFGDRLAFLAPGFQVWSTTGEDDFDENSGTSYACPIAAGVAALVLSSEPTLTRDQVLARLLDGCEQIGKPEVQYENGRNPRYGHGRIRADWAVNGKPKELAPIGPDGGSPHQGAVVPVLPPSQDGD